MSIVMRLTPAAAAVLLLASCGGGSAGAPPGSLVEVAATPLVGVAVDAYLSGATVLCDSNGNGVKDADEVSVLTNSRGVFTFTAGCVGPLVGSGGTNVDTGVVFTGVFKAPAGATVLSPLSTLIHGGASPAQLVTALGLPAGTDLLNTDPTGNSESFKKTLAVQQLLQKTTEMLAGLGLVIPDGATLQGVYNEVAVAFSVLLKGGGVLVGVGNTLDQSLVAKLVKAAADRVAVAPAVNSTVKAAVAALNSTSLSQVTSGALTVQAEAILKATDADLTSVTSSKQRDTTIPGFVAGKAEELKGASVAGLAALGTALTDLVAGITPAPAPAPLPTDYLALSTDSIGLVNGVISNNFTMTQFQSDAGISVAWPLASTMTLKVTLTDVGAYSIPAGQKLSAAVSITETTASGKGEVQAYIDNVDVSKTSAGLVVTVPTGANAIVYGVSGDGRKKAVIDFANSVAGIHNTLGSALGSSNTILLGNVVNYAINRVSNDFTGIYSLRGKYKVSLVITGLPLRRADGSSLPSLTIVVPTALNSSGGVAASKSVSGPGLVGFISLTD